MVEILVITILRACMVFMALLIEVVIYFKAPKMAQGLFRLNLSTLLDIGSAAIDALKIVGNLTGLAVGITALAGGIYGSIMPKGLRDNISGALFGKKPDGGGGGGPSSPKSDFSNGGGGGGGGWKTSESSGQTSAQDTATSAPVQNSNPATESTSPQPQSQQQNNGPSPKSQVDPSEFEAMLDKNDKSGATAASSVASATAGKQSLWDKAKGLKDGASLSKMKDGAVKGAAETFGNPQWWKNSGASALKTGAKVGLRTAGAGIQATQFAFKALSPFASAGMSLVAGDSNKAMETMKNAGKGFKAYSEESAAEAGEAINNKIYSGQGSSATTKNQFVKNFEALKENPEFDQLKDSVSRYERGTESTQEELDGLDTGADGYEEKSAKLNARMDYYKENLTKLKQELQAKEEATKIEKSQKYKEYSDIDTDGDNNISPEELTAFLDSAPEFKSDSLKNLAEKPIKGSQLYFAKQQRDKAISRANSMIDNDSLIWGGLSNKTVEFIEKHKDAFGPNALAEIKSRANALKTYSNSDAGKMKRKKKS